VTDNLTFNVAQLLKESVGATRAGQVTVDLDHLIPDLEPLTRAQHAPGARLTGPVRLMHTTDGVLVQGGLAVEVSIPCARCLEPVAVSLDVVLEETFAPTIDMLTGQAIQPAEEDRALWIDEHHVLDLAEVLRQDVLVAIPPHVLCREDCKGLCPNCGQNLNQSACTCQPEPDPRWAALVALLKHEE
jgi:uncharacterized protein